MKLKSIRIINFRNIDHLEYEAIPGLNVFMGDNAQGKTNILEAIYFLATANSFRLSSDKMLVKSDTDGFLLSGTHYYQERAIKTETTYMLEKGKKVKINDKKSTQSNPDRLRVVIFTPDDLYLVKGSPARRRKYLDFVLKQLSPEYEKYLEKYNNVLKRRNYLLRSDKCNGKIFDLVNEIFVEAAFNLITARINLLNTIGEKCSLIYNILSNDKQYLKVKYGISFPLEAERLNKHILMENMIKVMHERKELEYKRKKSMTGPHLDDINIYLQNKPARIYASQGQQRNIAVALKLAEISAIKSLCGFHPVFLLDEVLAELDQARRQKMIQMLGKAEYQSFLTTIMLENDELEKGKINIVKNGNLIKKGVL